MASKVTTLNPELLRELRWTIEQTKKLVKGNLNDTEKEPPKAPDDYIAWIPSGGIPGRDDIQIQAVWCDIYREKELTPATRGAPKEYEAIVDGSGTPFRLPIYNVYCEHVPGDQFVPTALLKSGTRYAVNWYQCESSSPSSSEESSSPSSSESSSSSSSSESSSSESSSPGCDYTGSITLGVGDLHRVGDDVCESRVTLRFEGGKLCEITAAPEACVYICCDESSSPSSSEESSSEESSSPSSSEESSSPSSSEESSSPSSSEESSSPGCVGECYWEAVADSSASSDLPSASAEPCGVCVWRWSEPNQNWSQVAYACDTLACPGANCSYPQRDGAYDEEIILWDCEVPS